MKLALESPLFTKPVAHRGLWNEKIVENSLSAYQNAVEKGYPIEIDLFETTDNKIVSFHDDDLFRMTDTKGLIYTKSYNELKKLKLNGSAEHIPLLQEVLELCKNKIPILIELKNQPSKTFVKNVLNILKNYKSEYAIQSFNPLYIKQVKDYDDSITRGLLSAVNFSNENIFTKFIVKNMPLNFLIKPDFISREYKGLPLKKTVQNGLPVFAWTITNKEDYEKVKSYSMNIIFENFIPD